MAKRLIEAVEADARSRGLPGVRLRVRVVLTANQKLFASMGYVETSREAASRLRLSDLHQYAKITGMS